MQFRAYCVRAHLYAFLAEVFRAHIARAPKIHDARGIRNTRQTCNHSRNVVEEVHGVLFAQMLTNWPVSSWNARKIFENGTTG